MVAHANCVEGSPAKAFFLARRGLWLVDAWAAAAAGAMVVLAAAAAVGLRAAAAARAAAAGGSPGSGWLSRWCEHRTLAREE